MVKEAQENFGPVETVVTNEFLGFLSAKLVHPKIVQAEIRQKAEMAVRRLKELKPYLLPEPVVLDISFKNIFDAETTAYLSWVKRTEG